MGPNELRGALAQALYTLGHPVRISFDLVGALKEGDILIHPEAGSDESVVELTGSARRKIASLKIQPDRTPEILLRFPLPEGVDDALLAIQGARRQWAWDELREQLKKAADGDVPLAGIDCGAAVAVLELMEEAR